MKILLSGSTGFVGSALFSYWKCLGYHITRLVRGPAFDGAVSWNPKLEKFSQNDFEGFDAVIHLAGEPIAKGRWTDAKKEEIFSSRVQGTKLLSSILAKSKKPPNVFISVSAVGYYGDAGEETLDEEGLMGQGFFPEVCQAWELAANRLEDRGCRVVHPRLGIVLGPDGGLLQKIKPLYQWGLGAILGSGQQWISWISLCDVCRAFDLVLQDPSFQGAVHFTAPHPVRQEEFSRLIGTLLRRPCFFKIPSWILEFVLGQMAKETLLASVKAVPKKLQDRGFVFSVPWVSEALQKALSPSISEK